MTIILKWAIIGLGVLIVLSLALVMSRETLRKIKLWMILQKRKRCERTLERVLDMGDDQILGFSFDLNKQYSKETLRQALDFMLAASDQKYPKLLTLYDYLGFIETHIENLYQARSWIERAEAAEKLGIIGHPRAVLPLIAVLQDQKEMPEVKNVVMKSLAKMQDPRAIAPLIDALGSSGPATGQPLADILIQFGSSAAEDLIKTLKTADSEFKLYWTASILGSLKSNDATLALIELLSDRREKVREAACSALGQINDSRAAIKLRDVLLGDPAPSVREKAAQALGALADEMAIDALERALSDMEYGARSKAREALETMGRKALPVFMRVLSRGEDQAKAQAASALERMGLVNDAIENLASQSKEASSEAWELLLKISGAGVVETIIKSLEHPNALVRIKICELLNTAGHPRGLEALLSVVQKDPDWNVRVSAARALVSLGDRQAFPVIVGIIKEKGPQRELLLKELSRLSDKAKSFLVPDIAMLARDPDQSVRVEAIRFLSDTKESAVIEPLKNCLKDAIEEVRELACKALGKRSKEAFEANLDQEVVNVLLNILNDPSHNVRVAAATSLGNYKDPQTVIALARAFEKADESFRDDIARAITMIDKEEIFKIMDTLVNLEHPKARAGIAWTLGLIKDEKGLKFLYDLIEDSDHLVRAAACGGLGLFAMPAIVPCLEAYLSDPNERVRAAVVNAIGKSEDPQACAKLFAMLGDPDGFVRKRAALAIASLAGKLINSDDLTCALEAKTRIIDWSQKESDQGSKVAAVISLTLLGDEKSFKECLKLLKEEDTVKHLKGLIKTLSAKAQTRFFNAISIDQRVFWGSRMNDEEAAGHYERILLTSRNSTDRIRAVNALSYFNIPRSMSALQTAFIKDPDPKVRAKAFLAVCPALKGKELIETLSRAINDPSEFVKEALITVLDSLSIEELTAARELIIPLLDTNNDNLREIVSQLLARLFNGHWSPLEGALNCATKKTRILGLLSTLAKINDPKTAGMFLKFLKHNDAQVRALSMELAALSGSLALDEVSVYLGDPSEAMRLAAVKSFSGNINSKVLDVVAQRAEDPSFKVRQALAWLLGKSAAAYREKAGEILKKLAKDENVSVKAASIVSLFRLGFEGLGDEIKSLVGDIDERSRNELTAWLETENMIAGLVEAAKSERLSSRRREALEFITSLASKRFLHEIVSCLQDPSSEVRAQAIRALSISQDPKIKDAINALADDSTEEVRLAVKWSQLKI
ncbi:HEAT repeat domain-containing protein [Elusimicrobiota bacterium]